MDGADQPRSHCPDTSLAKGPITVLTDFPADHFTHHHLTGMAPSKLTHSTDFRQPDVIVGIDTHKDLHVAVALAPNGGMLGEHRIPATRKGYDELIDWTEAFGYTPLFAVEGTSSYGAGLTRELLDAGFSVVEVNRPDRSTRRRLGKNDAIDVEAAARAWLAGTATIVPKAGNEQVEMIRMLKVGPRPKVFRAVVGFGHR